MTGTWEWAGGLYCYRPDPLEERLRDAATTLDAIAVTHQQPTLTPKVATLLRAVAVDPALLDAADAVARTVLGRPTD